MAVFGPQLIFTVIMFVLLTKLGKYYSFGRFLLCYKLFRYLSPGNEELKKSVRNFYKNNANSKNKKLSRMFEIDDEKEEFNIPEGCSVELSMSPVVPYDLNFIKYTDDFQTFVDLAVAAIGIYASTELYLSVTGKASDEINLSLVWCLMALAYGVATLSSITLNYLRSASEASLLYVFAALSFVVSLVVQMADTRLFDFNLLDAFRNVSRTTFELISSSNHSSTKDSKTTASSSHVKNYPTNELLFTCFIATLSGLIGALLFFPAFRLARLHFLCLKYSLGSKVKRFLYYLNFFLPLAVSICWLKADGFRRATVNTGTKTTAETDDSVVNEFLSMVTPETPPTLTYSKQLQANITAFLINLTYSSNLKIYLVLSLFLLRLVLYRFYAQSYLNLAYEMASYMKRNSQRITSSTYIKTISSVYQYYGVVASQYIIPLFVLLFMVFLLKTLGDLSWCGDFQACNDLVESVGDLSARIRPSSSNTTGSPTLSGILRRFESENFNVTMTHSALNKIFTPFVFRSLIGYFTFWTCTVWFLISCFGLLYYHYIDRQYIFED